MHSRINSEYWPTHVSLVLSGRDIPPPLPATNSHGCYSVAASLTYSPFMTPPISHAFTANSPLQSGKNNRRSASARRPARHGGVPGLYCSQSIGNCGCCPLDSAVLKKGAVRKRTAKFHLGFTCFWVFACFLHRKPLFHTDCLAKKTGCGSERMA